MTLTIPDPTPVFPRPRLYFAAHEAAAAEAIASFGSAMCLGRTEPAPKLIKKY